MDGTDRDAVVIDTNVAHAARVYDFLLDGVDNFEVDRRLAIEVNADMPGGLDGARANVRANRRFLGRTVRYLAGEAGVRQFLDIGTGVPNATNVHAVAQAAAPESRIVCVDNDSVVLGRAGAPCPAFTGWVSPARPPNRTSGSHRIRLSTCSC